MGVGKLPAGAESRQVAGRSVDTLLILDLYLPHKRGKKKVYKAASRPAPAEKRSRVFSRRIHANP